MSSTEPPSRTLTLPQLLSHTLSSLLPIFTDALSTSTPTAQSLLAASIRDLDLIERMLSSLGVFSANEGLEDVADGEMVFMAEQWVRGEVEGRVATKGIQDRLKVLQRSKASYESFISLITSYEVPSPPGALPSSSFSSSDPATRRDSKIAAYRLEKTLKDVIKTSLGVETDTPIYAMLELLKRNSGSEDQPQSSAQGAIRKSSLALLQLLRLQTESSLSFIEQEMTLLKNASESAFIEEEDGDEDMRKEDKSIKEDVDMTWRLDKPLRPPGARGKPSELIDERGKPLQPFTILPSAGLQDLSERARLQADVFRSSHRLPTMTIDEYLEEEQRRGNIITGGGPAQDAQLTTSELLALAAEEDGTRLGAQKSEEKRQKEEKWAMYTDEHKKGEGNTMNRG